MSFSASVLTHNYFPGRGIPFEEMLNSIFFNPPKSNEDFIIHGPNVVRFTEALLKWDLLEPGLFKDDISEIQRHYFKHYNEIIQCLEANGANEIEKSFERQKVFDLLKVAALFHDIGKYIRRENHPYIGANLVRNYDEKQQESLLDSLIIEKEETKPEAKHNRFSLISSIIQHHDKFGVLNTGEAALPIFSDILYFRSDEAHISGIKKNVTSVMLLNLADIAAVNTASYVKREEAAGYAKDIYSIRCKKSPNQNEEELLEKLAIICKDPKSCLGLDSRNVENILNDWKILIDSIDHERVKGNRVKLKIHLMELERNPARTIQRILRLLQTSAEASNVPTLLKFMNPTAVESILVGTLGPHYFLTFCDRMARAVKLDYGLKFFKSILCACVRKAIDPDYSIRKHREKQKEQQDSLSYEKIEDKELKKFNGLIDEDKSKLTVKITALFVRVLEGMIGRYGEILNHSSSNPGRFGFQMRDLTNNDDIRASIIDFLCIQDHKDSIALTWLADEVTIWAVD